MNIYENKFDKPLCAPDAVFTSKCHPEACGRKPSSGESAWTFQCTLEDGSVVALRMGRIGRDNFKAMLDQDDIDEAVRMLLE